MWTHHVARSFPTNALLVRQGFWKRGKHTFWFLSLFNTLRVSYKVVQKCLSRTIDDPEDCIYGLWKARVTGGKRVILRSEGKVEHPVVKDGRVPSRWWCPVMGFPVSLTSLPFSRPGWMFDAGSVLEEIDLNLPVENAHTQEFFVERLTTLGGTWEPLKRQKSGAKLLHLKYVTTHGMATESFDRSRIIYQ